MIKCSYLYRTYSSTKAIVLCAGAQDICRHGNNNKYVVMNKTMDNNQLSSCVKVLCFVNTSTPLILLGMQTLLLYTTSPLLHLGAHYIYYSR